MIIVVEVRRGGGGGEGAGVDIKSNNPHLAGGEKSETWKYEIDIIELPWVETRVYPFVG